MCKYENASSSYTDLLSNFSVGLHWINLCDLVPFVLSFWGWS